MLRNIVRKVKLIKNRIVEKELPKLVYTSRFLSDLYYFLFNNSFRREHQATLAGKVKHVKEAEELKVNYFMLIRNTHRIEKGLLMRPLKSVFAKDYIGETLDIFSTIWKRDKEVSNPQLKWCRDVLQEYFIKSGDDSYVQTQKQKFAALMNWANEVPDKKYIPYYRNSEHHSSICYNEFYKLTRQRRSVRWYLN